MAITLNGSTGITTDIDGDESLTLNRDTSDGDIITLQKNNTSVGSIGVAAGDNIYFAGETGSTGGIYINNAAVYPAATGGAATDTALDLGSSTVRWKDLYLSGGVYVGGSGSANHLDDYEEGSWTPGVAVGTASTATGNYRKVGNIIHVWGYVSGWSNTTNNESQHITNLPFAATDNRASGSAMWAYVNDDNRYGVCYVRTNATIRFYDASRNGAYDYLRCIDLDGSNAEVHFQATYYTG